VKKDEVITRYQQTGNIISYRDPSPKKEEEIKAHKRGKWVHYSEHKKISDDLDDEIHRLRSLLADKATKGRDDFLHPEDLITFALKGKNELHTEINY
jgi:hypothetical protein